MKIYGIPDFELVAIEVLIPNPLVFSDVILPKDWNTYPVPSSTQEYGKKWIEEQKAAVLKVPSSVITSEYNYLLNPLHPEFKQIKIQNTKQFSFDHRMWNKN